MPSRADVTAAEASIFALPSATVEVAAGDRTAEGPGVDVPLAAITAIVVNLAAKHVGAVRDVARAE